MELRLHRPGWNLLDQAAVAETVTLRVLLAQSSLPQSHLLARRNTALPILQAEPEGRQEVKEHIEPFLRKVFCCVLGRGLLTMSWCSLQNHLQVGYGLQKQIG